MTFALGTDCSFYQDDNLTPQNIDFHQMRDAGASFVILRAGQNSWVDPDFKENWLAAKVAGLPRGAYWFYDSRSTPDSQAKLFSSLILNDPPELYAWLDLEEEYGGTYKGYQNWRLCLTALRMYLPQVGVYTAPAYWIKYRPTGSIDLSFFKSFPLWIANYNISTPLIPSPWTSWLFWQHTSSGDGLRYGAESREIDLDYFNGTETTLRNWFNLPPLSSEPPTPPEPIGEFMYEGNAKTTNTNNVNVRKPKADGSLDETGMIIGAIRPGQAFKGDRLSPDSQGRGNWVHVTEVGGTPINGWSAGWFLDYHEVTPPPPPATEEYIVYVKDGVSRKFIPASSAP